MIKKSTTLRLPRAQQDFLAGQQVALLSMARHLCYRYLFVSFGTRVSPGDLLQEGLASMLTSTTYPPLDHDQLMRWAYSYIKRRAVTLCTDSTRDRELSLGHCALDLDVGEDPAVKVAEVLRVGKQLLSPRLYQVLEYRAAGCSGKEIAQALGMSPITARTCFYALKQVLLARHNWAD